MGFGSFGKSFKKFVGGGGGILGGALIGGLTATNPLLGIAVGSTLGGTVSQLFGGDDGAKDYINGLKRAGRIEEAQALEAKLFREQIIGETAGFREQGQLELERLQGQRPGETEFFKQSLERGTQSIAEQRDRFGLAESGRTGTQFEELGSNLLLQEELNRQQGIGRAAQLAQTGYGQGLQALQQQGGARYRQAQTAANIGSVAAGSQAQQRNQLLNVGGQAAGYFASQQAGGYGSPLNTSSTGANVGQNQWEIPFNAQAQRRP